MKVFGLKRSMPNRRNISEFTRGTEKFSGISIMVADITADNRIKCDRMIFKHNPFKYFYNRVKSVNFRRYPKFSHILRLPYFLS